MASPQTDYPKLTEMLGTSASGFDSTLIEDFNLTIHGIMLSTLVPSALVFTKKIVLDSGKIPSTLKMYTIWAKVCGHLTITPM